MPAGRPTEYNPEFCDKIVELMSQGYSYASFAAEIGVCRDTVNEWANKYPEFSVAKKIANDKRIRWWEDRARSRGYGDSGSDTMCIFMLKNAAPDLYNENRNVEVKSDNVSILGSVSSDTLAAIAKDLSNK